MKGAFFLDKDGTLVDVSGYPNIIPSDKLMEEDIVEGLKHIQSKDYKLIIVSNQSWISKNLLSENQVIGIFESVVKQLKELGVYIDDYFFCPHQRSDNCFCRKPKTKMIFDAARKHDIDFNRSFFVGDMDDDILLGNALGLKTVLVLTGEGKRFVNSVKADYVLENLNEVVSII